MAFNTGGLQALLDRDTYQAYLHRLDARALLEHYGATHCHEESNKDGTTEIVHSCLLDRVEPHHSNGDQNPSAACNVEKKTYVCYTLGFGCDLVHLVMKLEGKESFAEALGAVGQFLSGATADVTTIHAKLQRQPLFAVPTAYTIALPSYGPQVLRGFDHRHPYWDARGISPTVQRQLQLGYDPHENRIVFPHFVDTALVGWQKRVIPGLTRPDYPKYRNSSGFPKSETLYAHDLTDPGGPVLVVESPMSVAHAYSIGLRNVVATFGAKVGSGQIDLLKGHQKVIVWFDADPAGMAGERKLLEGLYRHTEVLRVRPEEGKDLADYDLDGFCRHTAFTTMPGALRLAEIDHHGRRHGR